MDSPPTVEIRKALRTELSSIVRLLADDKLGRTRESYESPFPASYATAFDEISNSDSNELLVALSENKVVGVLQITFIPYLTFKGGKRALIEGVRVDSDYRSQGIGRLMILEAIGRAKKRSCHMIQLTSNKSRPEAIQFYRSLGFEPTHEGLKLSIEDNHGT
ncbi:MAG: GNAT family N-acetyltransferase, partial [Opitutaceae bacterium]|nr:GNAT family N-acetyltransferase [Opitutaceae bacterium]